MADETITTSHEHPSSTEPQSDDERPQPGDEEPTRKCREDTLAGTDGTAGMKVSPDDRSPTPTGSAPSVPGRNPRRKRYSRGLGSRKAEKPPARREQNPRRQPADSEDTLGDPEGWDEVTSENDDEEQRQEGAEKKKPVKIRLDLNLEVEMAVKMKLVGSVVVTFL